MSHYVKRNDLKQQQKITQPIPNALIINKTYMQVASYRDYFLQPQNINTYLLFA